MLTGSLIAEHYAEPIAECDEKFDKCAEKCGDDASDECFEKCEAESDHCYKTYVYEDGSVPKVIEEEE
ncbi:hypothetical protein PGH07_06330 [Sulfurovum sp. zt1-1]|uniref:Uncharacterized protein n=2 Tax=Sulfurovum zhangzhouensis TaxID=3019067 RepID=A0ABT7QY78_9BACT|nr:hypothetical protein [Sulfurovum zhangzhouensis]